MKKKSYLTLIITLIAAVAIWWVYTEYNRKRGGTGEMEPAFRLPAIEMLREFTENEPAATKKYSGFELIVAIEGPLKEWQTDETGVVTLMLGDTASLSSVQCTMDSIPTAQQHWLQKGREVKLKGQFTGYSADETGLLGADIKLNHCVLENNNR